MKKLLLLALLLIPSLRAQSKDSADTILGQVYGTIGTACTQDADIDTGGANRVGPFTANKRYTVYCHDGAGAGVACEILQGTSTVDASAAVGLVLFAGEKMTVKFPIGKLYLSAVPFTDNMYLDVCPLD